MKLRISVAMLVTFVVWTAAVGPIPAFADGFGRGFVAISPRGAFSGTPFAVSQFRKPRIPLSPQGFFLRTPGAFSPSLGSPWGGPFWGPGGGFYDYPYVYPMIAPKAPPSSPWDFELKPAGTLAVRVQPADAGVAVDGYPIQATEGSVYEIGLLTGKHLLEISREGYESYSAEVQIEGSQRVSMEVSLPPRP